MTDQVQPSEEKKKSKNVDFKEVEAKLSSRLAASQRFQTTTAGKARAVGQSSQSWWSSLLGSDLFQRVTRKDVIILSRHLAMLMSIGIPVVRALHILSLRSPNLALRKIIAVIGAKVESGSSISEALAEHPKIFNSFYVNTVRAGEESGTADESLKLLAEYLEKETRIVQKFKSAMTYPLITMFVAICVAAVLFVKVIPVFQKVYSEAKVELPLPTTILLKTSQFIIEYFFPILIIIAALFITSRFLRFNAGFRSRIDWLKLHTPSVGGIISEIIIYRFAKLMSIMIKSGVPIHQAMGIAADAMGNQVTANALHAANGMINQGNTIENSLRETKAFRPIDIDIIGVGEETGSVDSIFDQMASAYEEDLQTTMENIAVFIEPLMLLIIGGMVALIALSLFMPYFSLAPVLIPQ
jgi:type IV pilus assembly protein PilC